MRIPRESNYIRIKIVNIFLMENFQEKTNVLKGYRNRKIHSICKMTGIMNLQFLTAAQDKNMCNVMLEIYPYITSQPCNT